MSDPTLDERVEALAVAGRLLAPFTSPQVHSAVHEVGRRAQQRASVGLEQTVVALAGSTGSGKSSLFNAITGLDLAEVGVLRPTTADPLACWWGEHVPLDLLDWLGVPAHLRVPRRSTLDDSATPLDGLVLLDLPDHDSMVLSHRDKVDRLVGLVDMVVWVTDPVKYGDALLHERYLSSMSRHGGVVVVVLNQVDLLSAAERDVCLSHLRDLLAGEGPGGLDVLATSAADGTGVDELTRRLRDAVARREAAAERLAADVAVLGHRLRVETGLRPPGAGHSDTPRHVGPPDVDGLVVTDGLHAALAVHRAQFAAGELAWPWTRTRAASPVVEPDLSADAVTARLDDYVEQATDVMAPMWRDSVRGELSAVPGDLVDAWGDEVRQVVGTPARPRLTGTGVRRAQRLVMAMAAAAVVLGVVAGFALAQDLDAALPAGIGALLAVMGCIVGGWVVNRRRRREQDDYASSEAAQIVEALRGRIRRDVQVHLELPLEQSRADHDAAAAALDLAEA